MYLFEAIESILNQTCKDYEIIVVDDGSNNDTEQILYPYLRKIKYICQKNKGPASARNTGIKNSSGKFIAFLDQDDIWLPKKIELQMEALEKYALFGLSMSGVRIINSKGQCIRVKKITDQQIENAYEQFLSCCFVTTPSQILIRKECFNKVGYFDEALWEDDWGFYIRISKSFEINFINIPLTCWRFHNSNLSSNIEKLEDYQLKTLDKIWSDKVRSKKYASKKKEAYHRIFFDLGVEYFGILNMTKARWNFINSLIYKPLWFKTYIYIFKTLFGNKMFSYIRLIKHRSFK